jgi:hypothetical protein
MQRWSGALTILYQKREKFPSAQKFHHWREINHGEERRVGEGCSGVGFSMLISFKAATSNS